MKGLKCNTGIVAWADQTADDDALILKILWKAGCVFYVRTTEPQTLVGRYDARVDGIAGQTAPSTMQQVVFDWVATLEKREGSPIAALLCPKIQRICDLHQMLTYPT